MTGLISEYFDGLHTCMNSRCLLKVHNIHMKMLVEGTCIIAKRMIFIPRNKRPLCLEIVKTSASC